MGTNPLNPELGETLGLAPGDTVELITDEWEGLVAYKGQRGKITHFVTDGPTIFTYVRFADTDFPFEPGEIKKVEASQ
ncbi:hypothetical protein [Streptomyces olivaceus]|uniref:hypothetical protein n=1 Tax=Streptomyces olivaceus TaxID=47716 RepID=UPI0036ED01EA